MFAGLLSTEAKRLAALEAVSGAGEAPSAFSIAMIVLTPEKAGGLLADASPAVCLVDGCGTHTHQDVVHCDGVNAKGSSNFILRLP